MPPVIQLTRRGTVSNDADVAALQRAFAVQHCAKLIGLIEPSVLHDVRAQIERGTFREFAHGSIATELRLDDGSAPACSISSPTIRSYFVWLRPSPAAPASAPSRDASTGDSPAAGTTMTGTATSTAGDSSG
jgi:hypothetical protein